MGKTDGKTAWRQAAQLILVFAVAAVLLVLVTAAVRKSGTEAGAHVEPLEEGWYYLEDGVKKELALPAVVRARDKEPLTLYYDGLSEEQAGLMLTTRGAQHGLQVRYGEELLYEYADPYFPRNTQMKSKHDCDAQLPAMLDGSTLSVTYEEPVRGSYRVGAFYIGDGSAVMWHHVSDSAFRIGIAFLFVVLGGIALCIAVYLHYNHLDGRRFVDTALFLFLCSVWFVTDSSITQGQLGSEPAVCIVSFYAFMLLAVPMVHFIGHAEGMEKYRVLDILILLFFANAIGQGLLNGRLGIDFVDMLWVTHLLLLAGVGITTMLMVCEYKKKKTREIGMILAAFAVLGASGVLSILLYWVLEISYYGDIFEAGIVIFVALILANIVMSMAENVHYRTEMQIYERLSREDWMTGMENREPFEDYLAELGRSYESYENIALVFLDLTGLRSVNGESGRAAGDELVLGAAKCIQNVFGADGRCYRIRGDEFSVVLPNPQLGREEWFARLDGELRQYNRTSRYPLALSRGWSELRAADGAWKTVSEWKFEADYRLNRDKGEVR